MVATLLCVLGTAVAYLALAVSIGVGLQHLGKKTTAPVSTFGDVIVRLDPHEILRQPQ